MKTFLQNCRFYAMSFLLGAGVAASAATVTVTPAPGTYNELSSFRVSFGDADWSIADASKVNIVAESNGAVTTCTAEKVVGFDISSDSYMAIEAAETIVAPDNYKLVLGAGCVVVDGVEIEETVFDYTVVELGEYTGGVTISPAPGIVASLHNFTLTFTDGTSLFVDEYLSGAYFPALYYYKEGSGLGSKIENCLFQTSKNKVTMSLFSQLSDPGTYALVIPVEFCIIDGCALTEPLIFVYTIPADESNEFDFEVTFDPANGATVQAVPNIVTTFTGVTSIVRDSFASSNVVPRVYLLNEDGSEADCIRGTTANIDDYSFVFTPGMYTPIEENGSYKYVIPARFLTINGPDGKSKKNDEIVSVFVLDKDFSGIGAVIGNAANCDVYNVNGVKVLDGAGADQIKSLSSGLYIINDKKIYIR